MRKLDKKNGFTLIEALVVVVVLSILVLLVFPSLGRARVIAKTNRTKALFGTIVSACEMYYADFSNYPDSDISQGNYFPAGGDGEGRHLLVMLLTGYTNDLKTVSVVDDSLGRPYGIASDPRSMYEDDGVDGPGFNTYKREKPHGPYNDLDKADMTKTAPAAFLDAFDNEIYYYKMYGGTYRDLDNTNGPSDINKYLKNSSGQYYRASYMLCCRGPDGLWYDKNIAGSENDDIMNND